MLIVICGKPRAGKTTLSKVFKCLVSHCDYRQIKGCVEDIKNTDKVCCEGLFETPRVRKRVLDVATGYKLCIWLNTSNNARRIREGFRPRVHEKFHFEPPTIEEGWDKIIIVKDNDYKNAEVIMKDSNLKGDLADG